MTGGIRATLRSLTIVAAALMTFLALSGCGVNNIPTYEEGAKAAWANVQNQYKRRADLVENLVNTVKAYAEQERTVLNEVTEARAKATQVQLPPDILNNPEAMKRFEDAQNGLGGALARLLVITENYPDIKSNQNFLDLQRQLEGTENRIAVARSDYIEAVRAYNTELRTIPGRWWKTLLYPEAQEMASFVATAEEQTTPKVQF